MRGRRSDVLVDLKVISLHPLHRRKTTTQEAGFIMRAEERYRNPGVGVTSGEWKLQWLHGGSSKAEVCRGKGRSSALVAQMGKKLHRKGRCRCGP